jgi:hypothetical protein
MFGSGDSRISRQNTATKQLGRPHLAEQLDGLSHTRAPIVMQTTLAVLVALSLATLSSAFSVHASLPRLARSRSRVPSIACRLGDTTGECSQKISYKMGSICETTPSGKQVCRKFSLQALGAFDDLDVEQSEVEDLPSWWILQAEEEYRAERSASHASSAHGQVDDLSY